MLNSSAFSFASVFLNAQVCTSKRVCRGWLCHSPLRTDKFASTFVPLWLESTPTTEKFLLNRYARGMRCDLMLDRSTESGKEYTNYGKKKWIFGSFCFSNKWAVKNPFPNSLILNANKIEVC